MISFRSQLPSLLILLLMTSSGGDGATSSTAAGSPPTLAADVSAFLDYLLKDRVVPAQAALHRLLLGADADNANADLQFIAAYIRLNRLAGRVQDEENQAITYLRRAAAAGHLRARSLVAYASATTGRTEDQ